MREEKDFFEKSFGKGNGLTFLYLKEKLQKKQTSPSDACVRGRLDRRSALWFEAMKTLRKSLREGAELFACQNLRWVLDVFLFFVGFWASMERFLWYPDGTRAIPTGLFSPPIDFVKIGLSLIHCVSRG